MLSITIGEMQIEITMRYHFSSVRISTIKKVYKQQMLQRVWRKGNPPTLLMGMQTDTATRETNMEASSEAKNRATL